MANKKKTSKKVQSKPKKESLESALAKNEIPHQMSKNMAGKGGIGVYPKRTEEEQKILMRWLNCELDEEEEKLHKELLAKMHQEEFTGLTEDLDSLLNVLSSREVTANQVPVKPKNESLESALAKNEDDMDEEDEKFYTELLANMQKLVVQPLEPVNGGIESLIKAESLREVNANYRLMESLDADLDSALTKNEIPYEMEKEVSGKRDIPEVDEEDDAFCRGMLAEMMNMGVDCSLKATELTGNQVSDKPKPMSLLESYELAVEKNEESGGTDGDRDVTRMLTFGYLECYHEVLKHQRAQMAELMLKMGKDPTEANEISEEEAEASFTLNLTAMALILHKMDDENVNET